MKEKLRESIKRLDFVILIIMTILIIIGLFCERQAFSQSEEQSSVLIKHIAGIVVGYVMILGILLIDFRIICNLSIFLYLAMVAILSLTLVIGPDINNVRRWIMIFGIQFQPSELTKIALIIFLAFLCNHYKSKLNKLYVLFILGAVTALPMLLILKEPHLSSCLAILFIFCIIIYASGIGYRVILAAIALVVPVVAGLIVGVMVFNLDIPFIEKYQIGRVLNFMSDDEANDLAGDFQQDQSIAAIASGGLQGKAINTTAEPDRKYHEIYANESDFVFSVVGEEFGFIGSFAIIFLYLILVIRFLIISMRSPDYMGRIICIGISSYFIFQIFVNVGVATKLLPNTGLPLPFISYGLTSLISSMVAVGMILNIGMRSKYQKQSKMNR